MEASHDDKGAVKGASGRRKNRKLMIVAAAIVVALVVVFGGWTATGGRSFTSVADIADDSSAIENNTSAFQKGVVEVQGTVVQWYGGSTFTLVDLSDSSKSIHVNATAGIPEGFENGKSAVVKGVIPASLPVTVVASGITVGCASRY